jgi:hypothetical protein
MIARFGAKTSPSSEMQGCGKSALHFTPGSAAVAVLIVAYSLIAVLLVLLHVFARNLAR